MTKKWYNIYSDERNGLKLEQLLQDLGINYRVKYTGLVVYLSINVNENFWGNKLRKEIERMRVAIKFTKNGLA